MHQNADNHESKKDLDHKHEFEFEGKDMKDKRTSLHHRLRTKSNAVLCHAIDEDFSSFLFFNIFCSPLALIKLILGYDKIKDSKYAKVISH